MELKKDMKSLIERAWSLHGRLNFEIQKSDNYLCKFCSENGHLYCEIAYQKVPFVDNERLISIRDSVKDVENILLFLQKLETWQVRERHEALTRLEESRLVVMELVRNYQAGKKTPDVLRDLEACFGDENAIIVRNLKERLRRHSCSFDGKESDLNKRNKWCNVSSLLKKLLVNWRWQKAIGIAAKFLILSVSVSSMVKISAHQRINYLSSNSRREVPSLTFDSTEAEMRENLLMISRNPLNVFQSRG